MLEWDDGMKIAGMGLWLDARRPKRLSFVSHAHSDHLGQHEIAISTRETAALAERRIGLNVTHQLAYGESLDLDADTRVTLHPAGHVLGSAMIRIERPEGSLLYTGDFKLRKCLTATHAEPPRADYLVTESTFGTPYFRFPPREETMARLVELVGEAMADGVQPIVFGYSLGKSQEIVKILTNAGFPVTEHGAVASMSDIYESHGVPLGNRRRYKATDFHGKNALELAERGVLVAPPPMARGAFSSKFEKSCKIVMTGWAMLKNAHFRYGTDHALPLSDHADFGELLETIEMVQPKLVYATHGPKQFVDELRKRGIHAKPAKPEGQLSLFE